MAALGTAGLDVKGGKAGTFREDVEADPVANLPRGSPELPEIAAR
jgi:hypothetical protein